ESADWVEAEGSTAPPQALAKNEIPTATIAYRAIDREVLFDILFLPTQIVDQLSRLLVSVKAA
ncbi:MAG: hypothetical protein ACXWPM_09195, partial [Bdellovibrionota bacterium]